MNQNTLKKIHEVNYKLLKEFKRICDENNIQYYLDSGSLLGAIRHQDLIPWDDDIDISLPREDYERFLKVAPDCLGENFELVMPGKLKDEAFFDFIPKIAYLPSKVHPDNDEEAFYGNKVNHICLDLFALDKIGNKKWRNKWHHLKLKCTYGMAMGHRYAIDYSRYTGITKMAVWFFEKIGRLYKVQTLVNMYNKLSAKFNDTDATDYYCSNYTVKFQRVHFKCEWFKPSTAKIADVEYSIPAGYDDILTVIYGDYMQLPKEEDRMPKHAQELSVMVDGELV